MEVKKINLSFSPEDKEYIKFFIHLYPGNVRLDEEEYDTAKENKISLELARIELDKQLNMLSLRRKIKIEEKKHNDGFHYKYIVLTEETKQLVLEYMDHFILKENPSAYIRILHAWSNLGDEVSKHKYNNILSKITKKYNMLLSLLITPITKQEIIQIGSILYEYTNQNDPIIKEILSTLEMWIEYGVIVYNEEKRDENIISVYKLSEDGINAIKINDMDINLSEKQTIIPNVIQKPNPKKVISLKDKEEFASTFMISFVFYAILVIINGNFLFLEEINVFLIIVFILQLVILSFLLYNGILPKILEKMKNITN